MKRRRRTCLMALLICLGIMFTTLLMTDEPVLAAEGNEIVDNGIKYIIIQMPAAGHNGKVEVGRNTSSADKVVIPETITVDNKDPQDGTYDVTAISQLAFYSSSDLTGITIPKSITVIKFAAFSRCRRLSSVTLEGDLADNGEGQAVKKSALQIIDQQAFEDCTKLRSIDLPEGLVTIGQGAFKKSGLTSLKVPKSLETIKSSAFKMCNSLTSVDLGSTLKNLEEHAFNRSFVQSVNIPASLETFGKYAFDNCRNLTSVTLPEGLKLISDNSFSATGIASITIPTTIETFGEYTFSSCKNLTSVTLTEGLKLLGNNAFALSPKLASVVIPQSITDFGKGAFSSCKKLTSVTLSEGMTTIGDSMFNSSGLTSIDIPDTVETLKHGAFSNCASITSILLPKGLKTIEEAALSATGITTVVIPDGVTLLDEYAFVNCESLTSVTLNDGLEIIGEGAFYNCAIQSITIPKTVNTISSFAFGECYNLTELQFEGMPASACTLSAFSKVPNVNTSTLYYPEGASASYTKDPCLSVALSNWNFIEMINAREPVITGHPRGASYTAGQEASPLTVDATAPNGGTLTYQWYVNSTDSTTGGNEINGATKASCTPDTNAAGTASYYCVVTNTKSTGNIDKTAQATSKTAAIVVTVPSHEVITGPETGKPLDLAKDAVFEFEGEYGNIAAVRLNSHTLNRTAINSMKAELSGYPDYAPALGDVKAGSVIVTLYKEFLQALPNGSYVLEVEFLDGNVTGVGSTEFEIKHKEPKSAPPLASSTPATGDTGGPWPWALLALAALAICGTLTFRRLR